MQKSHPREWVDSFSSNLPDAGATLGESHPREWVDSSDPAYASRYFEVIIGGRKVGSEPIHQLPLVGFSNFESLCL